MFKTVVHKYVKKVAWDYLCQATEASQLHAYMHRYGTQDQRDKYFYKTTYFMGLFYDACAVDPELRPHLNKCMARYRSLQRTAAKMPLPE